jgi:hydroxyacylglutathione hydrolase/adenylyltransferase/sulfurtransferase
MPGTFNRDDIDLTPEQVRERIAAGDIQLIDVREGYEWDAGRIEGARHIELERLAGQADSIDRETPVIFYCRLGARSGMAAHGFRHAGFEAYSMAGGLTEWDAKGLPLDPPDGAVADH